MKKKTIQVSSSLVGLLLLLPILFSCRQADEPVASTPSTRLRLVDQGGLRSVTPGDRMLVTGWSSADHPLFTTTATLRDGVWETEDPIEITQDGYVSCLYPLPSPLSYSDDGKSIYVSARPQQDALRFKGRFSPTSPTVPVVFEHLMARVHVTIDLINFSPDAKVEKVSYGLGADYGFYNFCNEDFTRIWTYADEFPIPCRLDTSGDRPTALLYAMPGENSDQKLGFFKIHVDGREYVYSLSEKIVEPLWESGKEYHYTIQLLNDRGVRPLTDEEKKKGIEASLSVDLTTVSHEYYAAVTSSFWRTLPNAHATAFGVWIQNLTGDALSLDGKVVLLDGNAIVCQGPTLYSLTVKPWHYDGFNFPLYVDVPQSGKYRLAVLLRRHGTTSWHRASIDTNEQTDTDWDVEVDGDVTTFLSRLSPDGSVTATAGGVAIGHYDTPTTAHLALNHYGGDCNAKIRLYYRRDVSGDGYSLLTDQRTWRDLLATVDLSLRKGTSHLVEIPYTLRERRHRVERFVGSLVATIEYAGDGVEHPLLGDHNQSFALACNYFGDASYAARVAWILRGLHYTHYANLVVEEPQ